MENRINQINLESKNFFFEKKLSEEFINILGFASNFFRSGERTGWPYYRRIDKGILKYFFFFRLVLWLIRPSPLTKLKKRKNRKKETGLKKAQKWPKKKRVFLSVFFGHKNGVSLSRDFIFLNYFSAGLKNEKTGHNLLKNSQYFNREYPKIIF